MDYRAAGGRRRVGGRLATRCALLVAGALLPASPAAAQRGGPDWITLGNDSQRSAWVRNDPKISVETLRQPGFQLLWKLEVGKDAAPPSALTPPALFDFLIGYRGFRSLAFVGASSGAVTALDVDLGHVEWTRSLGAAAPAAGSSACPGGMTSSVARPTLSAYPPPGVRSAGRSGPAKSGVGEPFEGAVTLKDRPVAYTPPPAPVPGQRVAPPVNPYAPSTKLLHVLTSDGKLHSLYVSNGEEPKPALPFLQAGAHAIGLLVFGDTAYAATINGCGGADDGIWALDLQSGRVATWKPREAPAGAAGFAAGPDGTLYVATRGGDLAALEPGTLTVKSLQRAAAGFTSSPVVFDHKGRDLMALAARDGRIHLYDTAALDKPLASTAVLSSPEFEVGALASWQDPVGRRWVLGPVSGAAPGAAPPAAAVAAFEVAGDGADLSLRAAWTSRDLVSPLPPVVVNGVVFALSSGESRASTSATKAEESARGSSPAVLYALDGATGKELWSSGGSVLGFARGGLAAGGGRVYVADHEGTQYAFGFPMEH
jgi:outer membrane protein assembly factor BamB